MKRERPFLVKGKAGERRDVVDDAVRETRSRPDEQNGVAID